MMMLAAGYMMERAPDGMGSKGAMMQTWGQNPAMVKVVVAMHFVTWVLLMAALYAFVRWLWKKGDKVK